MLRSDIVDNLTPKQKTTLEEFKRNVAGVKHMYDDDDFYSRWLIAREWDLKKAEKMFRDSAEWRKTYGADDLLNWEKPEVMKKYTPGGFYGFTKQGYPIWYELPGKNDIRGIELSMTRKDLIKSRFRDMEYLFRVLFEQQTKKHGKIIRQNIFLCDLEGFGLKHFYRPAISLTTEILSISEANYPETLFQAIIINGNKLIPLFYNVGKPFLAESTKSKIRVLGSNWREELQKDIDADQIPVHWGGTATDPDGDPCCKSRICMGGEIPKSYHLKVLNAESVDLSQFTTITISNSSATQLEYKVTQSGCYISWNFWTKENDIAFGVYLRTNESKRDTKDMVELIPNQRVRCHLVPETGTFPCEKTGTYVIRFDNTYSWMKSKKLSYLIEVVEPDRTEEIQRVMDSTDF